MHQSIPCLTTAQVLWLLAQGMQQQMYLEVPLIPIPLGHAVSMAACGGVATRGLMPGIRIHEIYAVGSIAAAAEAPFLGSL